MDAGASLNIVNNAGQTLLEVAANTSTVDMNRLLLSYGPPIDLIRKTKSQRDDVPYAVGSDEEAIYKLFQNPGADKAYRELVLKRADRLNVLKLACGPLPLRLLDRELGRGKGQSALPSSKRQRR